MPKLKERVIFGAKSRRKSSSSDDGSPPAKRAFPFWSDEEPESAVEDTCEESDINADHSEGSDSENINTTDPEIAESLTEESSDEADNEVGYEDSGSGKNSERSDEEDVKSLSEGGHQDSTIEDDGEETEEEFRKEIEYGVKRRLITVSSFAEEESDGEEEVNSDDNKSDKTYHQVKIDQKSAFEGHTKTFTICVEPSFCDVKAFFNHIQKNICKILGQQLIKLGNIQASFDLHCSFVDNEFDVFCSTAVITVSKEKDLESCFNSAHKTISSKLKNFKRENEGEIQISCLDLHIHKKNIGYFTFIQLPPHLQRDVVSVFSTDNLSFKWAVLAGLHPEVSQPSYGTLEQFSNDLILEGIDRPVKLDDIAKIEEQNDISINVFVVKYSYETCREEIEGPVYHTKHRRDTHLNLLVLYDENNTHYCHIKNLNRLVDPFQTGLICDGCLCFFKDNKSLRRHQKDDCFRIKTVISTNIKMDEDEDVPMPIVVYADFEALNEPSKDDVTKIKKNKNNRTQTTNVSKHVPYGFAYYIKCISNDKLSRLKTYYGLDCEKVFFEKLISTLTKTMERLRNFEIKHIPVFFHNFRHYDGHFVIKGLESLPGRAASGLGNKHNFLALHKDILVNNNNITLRFVDSRNFLKGSIEALAQNLNADELRESRRFWKSVDDDAFNLLTQKGVFPYDYITSIDDLKKTSLPKKKHFYNSLKAADISDDDYERAREVWKKFSCKTILDYSTIYLKVDVLLLADLFENLRRTSLETYEIDPARYYSMSTFSWNAMLKMTGVELEPLTDVCMLSFLKKAMRGGVAHCTRRHAVANNKYLPTYKSDEDDSYLMYYDANNLYGWAMSQPLPYGGFEWVDADVNYNVPDDSDIGYFLEVDIEYPEDKRLHNCHADYPFCPEKKLIPGVDNEMLITDLTSKKHYVLHHSYLNQCVKNGPRIVKIHRVLKFNQKPWLKPYITFNTNRRAKARNDSEKDFYKKMNNSIYGMTVRNIEKDVEVKIATHWAGNKYERGGSYFTGQPEYHSHMIVSENTLAVQLNKTKRVYKHPVYVGYSVLDLAKACMYKFHYGFMKKKFGKNLKLLYTDTDSFVYQIFTEDYYNDMIEDLKGHFDTSDYPEDNQFGYPRLNKKRVGFFKDEFGGAVAKEFVALRPKVYMIEAEGKTVKAAQSAPKELKDQFTIEDYKRCLYDKQTLMKEWVRFRADRHEVFTQRVRRAVLRPNVDSKRQWLEDELDSLPFGHYRLKDDWM